MIYQPNPAQHLEFQIGLPSESQPINVAQKCDQDKLYIYVSDRFMCVKLFLVSHFACCVVTVMLNFSGEAYKAEPPTNKGQWRKSAATVEGKLLMDHNRGKTNKQRFFAAKDDPEDEKVFFLFEVKLLVRGEIFSSIRISSWGFTLVVNLRDRTNEVNDWRDRR